MNSNNPQHENIPNIIKPMPQDVVCPVCNKLTPYEASCRFCGTSFLQPQTSGMNLPVTPISPIQATSPVLPQTIHQPFSQYYPQTGYYSGYNQQPLQNNPYTPYYDTNNIPYSNPYLYQKQGRSSVATGWIIGLLCTILVAIIFSSIVILSRISEAENYLSGYYYDDYGDYGGGNWFDDYFNEGEDPYSEDPYGGLFNFEDSPEESPEAAPEEAPDESGDGTGSAVLNNISVTAYQPRFYTVGSQGTYLSYNIILTNNGTDIESLTPENFSIKVDDILYSPTSEADSELDIKSMQNIALAPGEEVWTRLFFKVSEDLTLVELYIEDDVSSESILISEFS